MITANQTDLERNARTIFKEATDFIKAVGRQLLEIGQVTIFGIINTNCNYLIIFLTLVAETDKPSML